MCFDTNSERRLAFLSTTIFLTLTPLAFVFIVIFLILTGVFAFFFGGFFERGGVAFSHVKGSRLPPSASIPMT